MQWIDKKESMPDTNSKKRVLVFTPTQHEDMRYRLVPSSLFKAVCRDGTHWMYVDDPKE